MKRIQTKFPHERNHDGTRRATPCSGTMEIVCESGVYACCNKCGEGYRFPPNMGYTAKQIAMSGDGTEAP